MDIIEKFGSMVGTESLKNPEKARKLLLAGYRLQEKRLQIFPDKDKMFLMYTDALLSQMPCFRKS